MSDRGQVARIQIILHSLSETPWPEMYARKERASLADTSTFATTSLNIARAETQKGQNPQGGSW